MKVGFIGFGKSVHRYHMPFIDVIDSIEVVGYWARGRSQFDMPYPRTEQLTRFETIEDLLESEVELIIVCTSALHYQFTKLALQSGKHVLCEKPLCDTLEQATELYQIADRANLMLCPYQNRRFDHDFVEVFSAIETNQVGQVAEIISNHTQNRFVSTNQQSNKYNGMVYGHAVHFVDQIISKYGQPENVIYDITNQRDWLFEGTGNVDDYYHLQLVYKHLRVGINFTAIAAKEPPRFVVYGSHGTIEKYGIDNQEVYLKQGRYLDDADFGKIPAGHQTLIYDMNGNVREHHHQLKFYDQFYRQLEHAINGQGQLPVSQFEAKVVINILETIVNNRVYKKI